MDQDSRHSNSMNSDNVSAEKGSGGSNDDGGLNNELSSMTIGSNELSTMSIDTSSSKKKKKNTCLCCLKEVEGSQRCSRCGTAHYCGKLW